jgi:hypothetical protein
LAASSSSSSSLSLPSDQLALFFLFAHTTKENLLSPCARFLWAFPRG